MDLSSERESIAEDGERASVRGVIWLHSDMDDDRTSGKADSKPCVGFMMRRRAVVGFRLVAPLNVKTTPFAVREDLVVHESKQDGSNDIVPEGIGAAAERVVHLTIMERRKNGTLGD
jgi:uncharacterized protein (DUF1684 family)